MSNEDFNKLTSLKLYEIETSELRQMIPTMKESFNEMAELNPVIVNAMIQMAKDFVQSLLNAAQSGDGLAGYIWKLIWQIPGEPGLVGVTDTTSDIKTGKSEIFETLPPPLTLKEKQKTQQEKDKEHQVIQKDIGKSLVALSWMKVVGQGHTRQQIRNAIKYQEGFLKQLNGQVNKWKVHWTQNKNSTNKIRWDSAIIKRDNQIKVVRHYKDALSWLNKQGTGGAKVTP